MLFSNTFFEWDSEIGNADFGMRNVPNAEFGMVPRHNETQISRLLYAINHTDSSRDQYNSECGVYVQ